MSEFRRDPLSDHWVIMAPNRAQRPEQFEPASGRRAPPRCPFCRGHECDTPGAVLALAADGQPCSDGSWQVRVIPNLYPAVEPSAVPVLPGPFFERRPGVGMHEVIVEAPDHVVGFTSLTDAQVAVVLRAYRDRLRQLRTDRRVAYAQIFKNAGAAAGASLEHVHSQLIATAVIPTQVQRELAAAEDYHRRHGRCVFCDMVQEELQAGERIVTRGQNFVAFCPYASQFPYEVWILPRAHCHAVEDVEDVELEEFAWVVRDCIRRVESALGPLDFNYLIHTSPFDRSHTSYYHYHIEFSPRLVKTAGFEWGAGDYINTVCPEEAADALRRARM